MIQLSASQLYKLGYFNTCMVMSQGDGVVVYFCDGEKAPAPFHFQARNLLTLREEILYDPIVTIEAKND